MKRFLGMAVVGMACLVGCATDMSAAGYSSEMGTPSNVVARNPSLTSGESGMMIEGTVISDSKDILIVRDYEGFQRGLRVDEQTLFSHEEGGPIARKFLEPGSHVRTAWDYSNQERIALEVIILNDTGSEEPNAWPEDPSPYHP